MGRDRVWYVGDDGRCEVSMVPPPPPPGCVHFVWVWFWVWISTCVLINENFWEICVHASTSEVVIHLLTGLVASATCRGVVSWSH